MFDSNKFYNDIQSDKVSEVIAIVILSESVLLPNSNSLNILPFTVIAPDIFLVWKSPIDIKNEAPNILFC